MEFTYYNDKIIGQLEYGFLPVSPNNELGYRPFELFISSLVGCSSTLLANILVKKRVEYKRIDVKVEAVRNKDESNRIEQLTMYATIQSEEVLKQQQIQTLTELVIKNCGLIQSVIKSIDIDYQIDVRPDPPQKGDVS